MHVSRELLTALRSLRSGGSLPLVVVLMLAIAIAAVTVVFSVANAVLLRPLPFARPAGLVTVWGVDEGRGPAVVELGLGDLRAWREQNTTMQRIEIFGSVNWSHSVTAPGEPFNAMYAAVSGSFFETLGARAMMGRTFRPEEDRAGAPGTVILSAALWRRRFSSNPDIIGTSITIGTGADAQAHEVIGVMGPDFRFPAGAEMWTPAFREMDEFRRKSGAPATETFDFLRVFYAIGRLADGVSIERAGEDLSGIARRVDVKLGNTESRAAVVVTPLTAYFFGPARPVVLAITGAVFVLLLIACANAAGLLLVRGAARHRELALRLALGATRRDIVVQCLTESSLLAVVAGAMGFAAAYLGFDVLVALVPADVPRLDNSAVDATSLFFTAAICFVMAVIIGLIPAWRLSRATLTDVLREQSYTSTGARASRSRQVLVVAQLAAAVVLLTGAGLLARSFVSLVRLDLGFDPRNVLTFDVSVPEARYKTDESRRALVERVLDQIQQMPEAVASGAIFQRPFANGAIGMDSGILLEGQPLSSTSTGRNPIVNWESVTPGYFRAMDLSVTRGRAFDARDVERSPKVGIVSESLAARLWPGVDPIGKRFLAYGSEDGKPDWQTVVGVVEDARYREIQTPRFDLYLPFRQAPTGVKHYVIRVSGNPMALVPALRERLRRVDAELTIENATTMERIVDRTIAPWWFSAFVFVTLSAMALAFAATGLFAVIAYAVRQRTREIGIRIALGARAADVVGMVVREGATLAAAGLTIGIPSAWLLSRTLESMLFAVTPTDRTTFGLVVLLLIVVALLAAWLPARAAARVDPLIALRAE